MGPLPLSRLLSRWHVASRTQAKAWISAGRVRVNGVVRNDVLFPVDPEGDRIEVDGRPVGPPTGAHAYVVLNKPRGVVTTTRDPEGRQTVMDLVPDPPPGLAPVGRLDKDSGGLLLLTNDHALADRLLDPRRHVRKTYRVKVRGHVTAETLARLSTETVETDGLRLGPLEARIESEGPKSTWLEISLSEGKNRQIRRQLAFFGHAVEVLVRTAFGPVALGGLEPGASRALSPAERGALGIRD
jgi:23S rRNA pseudouridine2605 synthase